MRNDSQTNSIYTQIKTGPAPSGGHRRPEGMGRVLLPASFVPETVQPSHSFAGGNRDPKGPQAQPRGASPGKSEEP